MHAPNFSSDWAPWVLLALYALLVGGMLLLSPRSAVSVRATHPPRHLPRALLVVIRLWIAAVAAFMLAVAVWQLFVAHAADTRPGWTPARFLVYMAAQPLVFFLLFRAADLVTRVNMGIAGMRSSATTLDQLRRAGRLDLEVLLLTVALLALFVVLPLVLLVHVAALALLVPLSWACYWAPRHTRRLVAGASTVIEGGPDEVSAFFADLSNRPRWWSTCVSATPDPQRPGVFTMQERAPDGRVFTGDEMVTRDGAGPGLTQRSLRGTMYATYAFAAAGTGTMVTMATHGALRYGRALRGRYWSTRRRYLPGAEQRHQAMLAEAKAYYEGAHANPR